MLSGEGEQPQRWAIVATETTSMGHRCGCPAPSSIDVPIVAVTAPGGWRPSARCQEFGPQRRAQKRDGNRVARNGAAAPDAVIHTLCVPEPAVAVMSSARRGSTRPRLLDVGPNCGDGAAATAAVAGAAIPPPSATTAATARWLLNLNNEPRLSTARTNRRDLPA